MKTLTKYLPGKRLTMIQCLTTLLLVIVICCVSFGTVFSLTYTVDEETEETFYNIIEKLGGNPEETELPTQVDVNAIFLVKSLGAGFTTVKAVISGRSDKGGSAGMIEDTENIMNNKDKILSEDTINFAAFVGAMAQSFQDSLLLGACNVLLVIMSFVFPITLFIKCIIAIIGFLCHFTSDWGKAFMKTSKAIYGAIELFPMLLFLMVLVPEVQFGWAVYSVLWLCVAALLINLAASRLKLYEAQDFKYLNILQIVSACSFVGFLMFFFGIAGTNIIEALWKEVSQFSVTSIIDAITGILTVILLLIIISGLMSLLKFMTKSVTRLACMSKSKHPTHIIPTSMGLVTVLALVLLMFTTLPLDLGDGTAAFVVAVVGVVIMFACEILLMILPAKLCPEVNAERRRAVFTGTYSYEAPSEETPTEETPTEETPAEEISAE